MQVQILPFRNSEDNVAVYVKPYDEDEKTLDHASYKVQLQPAYRVHVNYTTNYTSCHFTSL